MGLMWSVCSVLLILKKKKKKKLVALLIISIYSLQFCVVSEYGPRAKNSRLVSGRVLKHKVAYSS